MTMWKALVVLITAACAVQVKKSPNFEIEALAAELPGADQVENSSPDVDALAQEFPEFRKGLLRYGHHLHKRRDAALLKHSHNVHHKHSLDLDLDLDADDKVEDIPMTLPGRHPSVEKALDTMSDDLVKLKESRQAAKDVRGQLEGEVADTFHHLNDRMAIKRAIQKKEQEIRIENGKLDTLEKSAGRLQETHDSLVTSLGRMLGPKVMMARGRLAKKERVWHKEESSEKAWKEKTDKLKATALELIAKKKASFQALQEAEAEVAEAKKKEKLARMKYERDRTQTAEHVQSYRYSETRYKAEHQHEEATKKAALEAQESVRKLYNVEHIEEEKVEGSILYRKDKLRGKMQQLQAAREKSNDELAGLKHQYRDWQVKQHERTAEVMKKTQETEAASAVFQNRQQQVLDNARAKVVQEAEGAGDWDGWGGNAFTKIGDEDDDDI